MRFYQILREVQSHFPLRLICLSHGNHTRLEVIHYGRSILQLRLRLRGRLPPGRESKQLGLLDSGAVLPLHAPPGGHFDDCHQAGRRRPEEVQTPRPAPLLYAEGAGADGRPHRPDGRSGPDRPFSQPRHRPSRQQPAVPDVLESEENDHSWCDSHRRFRIYLRGSGLGFSVLAV